jgi:hypothetical protein
MYDASSIARIRPVPHPKGPSDVARDDPNRIVAVFDGKELTAQQAWNMLKKV